jgi:predicted transcriptional regulator
MSTSPALPTSRALAILFGSEARAAVLACLFTRPEEEIFLRDVARHCGMAVTPVYRQLQKLEQIGLVESRMLGKARAYRLHKGRRSSGSGCNRRRPS